jgi:hypothetical protein
LVESVSNNNPIDCYWNKNPNEKKGMVTMKNFIRSMTSNFGVVSELLAFLWQRKLWWLIPMVVVLLVFGLLLVFASASGIGPFIYTLF